MKRTFYIILTLCFILLWSSCRKDFDFEPSSGTLQFSKDTVYLDTVFNNIGSSTYQLKVYNRSNNDIVIPTLQLGEGENSYYRLNVDGIAGKIFKNIELLSKDSLYIFIETTIDFENLNSTENQFLYTDVIAFDSGPNAQKVELVTLVRDAVFIFPTKNDQGIAETLSFDTNGDGQNENTEIQGRFLKDDELTFTNKKPYVIYGYAAVNTNKTLTIEAGARIYFHANSGLLITNKASLHVLGELSSDQKTLDNEVIFQGDRLTPLFQNIPGQWGTIWLFQGSENNIINYATIKNATIGILAENDAQGPNPKLTIQNSKIYNSSNFGVLGRATSITANNLVVHNAGQSAFAGTYGGKYNFIHSTITNYWTQSYRQMPALYLNNFMEREDGSLATNPLSEANFFNCIIYGNEKSEIALENYDDAAFNFKFENSLIKFPGQSPPTDSNYNFENTAYYENIVLNKDPDFYNTKNNKLYIGEASAARNIIGSNPYSNAVPFDIVHVSRTALPDVGAYQYRIFED